MRRQPLTAKPQAVGRRGSRTVASGSFLYAWLLLAIFFEYARPSSFVPALAAIPLNSAIPLGLLFVSSLAPGLRPVAKIWRDPASKWMLVYFGLIALSILHASVTLYAVRVTTAVLGYFFLFIMITRIVTTQARLYGVIGVILAAHTFLIGMNSNLVLDPSHRTYITGSPFLGDGNDFALSLCVLLPLVIGLTIVSRATARRVLLVTLLALMMLAIVATQSRGGTVAMAAVFGYLWLRSRRRAFGVMVLGACAVLLVAYAPGGYYERMRSITIYQADTSATARIEAWKAGSMMAVDSPLLGVGAGNFPHSFPRYRGHDAPVRWMNAHSMYFLVLGEMGVPGLIVLVALVIGGVVLNRRCERQAASLPRGPPEGPDGLTMIKYTSAALVGFAVAGAFLSVAYYPHVFVLTGICVAQRALLAKT